MKHELFITASATRREKTIPLSRRRISRAKRSFVTRRADLDLASGLARDCAPRRGDIILAQVESLGHHRRLEDVHGRRVTMFEGDDIIVAFGDRYAPDQFEANVPETLGPCELVAGGGIASNVLRKSAKARAATQIIPVGILTDATGRRLNVEDFAIAADAPAHDAPATAQPKVIAVVGSSMNAGKTTAMASLLHGECRSGRNAAAIKVTGTGSGGDLWAYRDAGAELCLDFTDAGYATTHKLTDEERIGIFENLLARCRATPGIDTIVVEVADGILFPETERLILSDAFRLQTDAVIYAAADAMGALAGAKWLSEQNLPLVALSGAFTASPIAAAEAWSRTQVRIVTREALMDGGLCVEQMGKAA